MTFVICKDCGDQFRSPHPEGKIGEISDYANSLCKAIKTVSCMDQCQKNKMTIYKIPLKPDVNLNIKSLSLDETLEFIRSH